MVLRHYYDGTLLTNAVQLAEEHSFSARAATGDADIVGVIVEDPTGTLDFVGDRRWTMVEDTCPVGSQTVWRGYTGKQSISGGGGDTIYPDGVGRRWNLDLVEDNTCLGFRVVTGTDGKRPAETVSARLTWILASPYLSGLVADHGLVATSTVALDAHDFRGQSPIDVLADLAIATGFNYYARYREASDDVELAFYDADTSALDASTLRISNDPADIDYVTTWPAAPSVTVERDPSRYARGIYLPYAKGAVYVPGGPGLRDMTAPSATVKTAAKATTLATRLLAQHAEQDEKLTGVRVHLPAANLNDVRHGQRIAVRQTHLPGWTSFRDARVVSKSFGRPDNLTQAFYDVDLDLSRATNAPSHATGNRTLAGAPFLVTLPSAPGEGTLMLTIMTCGIAADDGWVPQFGDGISGTNVTNPRTWTYLGRAWAYDATQYGGPGPAVQIAAWYRLAGAAEGATVGIQPDHASLSEVRATVIVFDSPLTPTLLTTASDTIVAGTWSISGASTGYWLGAMALQRTDYAPADVITTTAGTEVTNLNGRAWHYVAWHENGDIAGTIAANPNLNKWGRAALGIRIPTSVV